MRTKKNEVTPVLVYQDHEYESQIQKQLEKARQSLNDLLIEWHKLDIGDCSDLHELLLRPEQVYKLALDKSIKIPDSGQRFGFDKQKYISGLTLPDSAGLYSSAKAALRQPFSAVGQLWQIIDSSVQLIEEEASLLCTENNIYCRDPDKIKLAEDLTKFVELFNSLNSQLNYELFLSSNPVTNTFFRGWGSFEETDGRGNYGKLAIIPDTLKRWLSL